MVGLRHPGADGPGAYSGTRAPSVPIRTYQRIRFGSVNLSESTLPADRALATSSCCSASLHDSERRVVEGPVSNEIRSLGAMTKREDTTRRCLSPFECEWQVCSGCRRWPLAGELTLTGSKQSLGLATAGVAKVSYTRISGRKACARRSAPCR